MESLVVKFGGGARAGRLNATGTPADYANRVGGSIQIVGQPNAPVILTSIAAIERGAGFGIDGAVHRLIPTIMEGRGNHRIGCIAYRSGSR